MWRRRRSSDASAKPPISAVDGRVVGRAIRESVRPLLKDAGFTSFTDRKAWRETEYTIDHVTFRSYNAYNAGVLGCTSYSFTVEVGVFYRFVDPSLARPQDYHCAFRAILGKTIRQPFFATEWGPAQDRPEVLYVLPNGANLSEVIDESRRLLGAQGLPFIDHYNDPERAFASLLNERMSDVDFGKPHIMLPGNPDSPAWHKAALGIGHLIIDDPRPLIRAAPVLHRA
jgi:hypothetical protein